MNTSTFELRNVYDMDEDYNLLSWNIPRLKLTLKLGDKFIINGEEKTLTELSWSADTLGIYAMRPVFNGNHMILLPVFATMFESGEIKIK